MKRSTAKHNVKKSKKHNIEWGKKKLQKIYIFY